MSILTIPEPNDKQKLFFNARNKFIAYGGAWARGGGKSWAIRVKAIMLACNYAGIKILIVRRTYKELEGNHIRILQSMCKDIARYNGTNKMPGKFKKTIQVFTNSKDELSRIFIQGNMSALTKEELAKQNK